MAKWLFLKPENNNSYSVENKCMLHSFVTWVFHSFTKPKFLEELLLKSKPIRMFFSCKQNAIKWFKKTVTIENKVDCQFHSTGFQMLVAVLEATEKWMCSCCLVCLNCNCENEKWQRKYIFFSGSDKKLWWPK